MRMLDISCSRSASAQLYNDFSSKYGVTAEPIIIALPALRAEPASMPVVGPSILGLTPFLPATIEGFRPFV